MLSFNGRLDEVELHESDVKSVISTISHELRTPLNAIIGFSELIQEENSLKNIKSFANIIQLNGSILLNKIHSIIDFNILDYYSDVCFEEINIYELIHTVFDGFINNTEHNGSIIIEVNTHNHNDSLTIYSDRAKIEKILLNILSNALKFTKKGKIEIGYDIVKDSGFHDKLLLYVSDTGIGIPEEKLKLIFRPFRQADESYCANIEGLGMGLAICDKLAKIIFGKIKVESRLNFGSVFYLELPFNGLFSVKNEIQKEKNILIVEDNDINYFQIMKCLNQRYFNVIRIRNLKHLNGLIKSISALDFVIINSTESYIKNYEFLYEKFPGIIFIVQTLNENDFLSYKSDIDNLHFIKVPINNDEFIKVINTCLSVKIFSNNI
ncbi:MAG: sensor histidine kinase [Bacteroidales bacterium]